MRKILEAINEEIIRLTHHLAHERRHPGVNPDDSDETIEDVENRIAVLRDIRKTIEDSYI